MSIESIIAILNNSSAIKTAAEEARVMMAIADAKSRAIILSCNQELDPYRADNKNYKYLN